MANPNAKRAQQDLMKLVMGGYTVEMEEHAGKGGLLAFVVKNFKGPAGTAYEGAVYHISVYLPAEYPFRSPSIGFRTRIFHPNIDERSGSVCLDVINQAWSPMYGLHNVFDVFLPQLLTYGNAADPLNGEAAALMTRDPDIFKARVKEYTAKYCTPATDGSTAAAASASSSSSSGGARGGAGGGSGSSGAAATAAAAAASSGGGSGSASTAKAQEGEQHGDEDGDADGAGDDDADGLSDLSV